MAQNRRSSINANKEMSSAARARDRMRQKRNRERRRRLTAVASVTTAILLTGLVLILFLTRDEGGNATNIVDIADYDNIFPKVSAAGIDLSGMSMLEAGQTIQEEMNARFKTDKVTVSYETDRLDIYASDVGMKVNADEVAAEAYAYGRNLSPDEQKKLINGKGEQVELEVRYSMDETLLEQKIDAFIALVGDDISVCNYELTETSVVVDFSSGGQMLDKATIKNDVKEMLLSQKYETYEAVPITLTPENLRIDEIYQSVYSEPVDAYFDYIPASSGDNDAQGVDPVGYSGKLKCVVRGGEDGLSFDLEAAKNQLASAGTQTRFEFPLIRTSPPKSRESLENKIYSDVLSSYSTKLTKDKGRTENIRLAAEAVNGTEIMPGQTFSYNDTVGKRTEEKGYQKAAIFVKGEVVDDIGGGICQLSSTIYITTLLSNLTQVERSPHRYAVAYTPLGQDATVAWGSLDYKFKNNTEYPIKLKTYLEDGMVKVILYGTKTDGYTYKLESTEDEKIDYEETQKYVALGSADAVAQNLTAIGQKKTTGGKYGYKSTTYLITMDSSGKEVARKQVNKSTYRTQAKVTYICCVLDASGNPVLDASGKPIDPNTLPTTEPTSQPDTQPSSEPTSEVTTEPVTEQQPSFDPTTETPPTPDAG